MGGAILVGALRTGMPPNSIAVIDPQPSKIIQELARSIDIRINPCFDELHEPDLLLVAVKPQMFDDAVSH
jgi:pyrroline-5-carboxylate reductase